MSDRGLELLEEEVVVLIKYWAGVVPNIPTMSRASMVHTVERMNDLCSYLEAKHAKKEVVQK